MSRGGKRPNAGRKAGTKGRRTEELEQMLASLKCNPLELLARISNGEPIHCRIGLNTAGDDFTEGSFLPTFDQRMKAAIELAQYVAPKRKAVEHSGSIGTHEETLAALAGEDE